jgi:mono/diheme cytochrome c family protein
MCANCHGADGRPPAALTAQLGVRDLSAGEFRARVTPGLVEQQVRSGSKNKLMPSFVGAIDDAQIKAVAAYVASPEFARPAAPR